MHPMLHGIYEYMTLTICKMYINYASMHPMHLKKGYYYSYGLILGINRTSKERRQEITKENKQT